jgi:ankyrin repeat protein
MTAPLSWPVKGQLVDQFRAGAADMNESGQYAFNLAACYALGFGVRMCTQEAFHYLELSAKQNYVPAKVLQTAFNNNGLIQKVAPNDDIFSQYLDELERELLQVPPLLRFTARIRRFYKNQFAQMANYPMTIAELGITSQGLDAIKNILLAETPILHELDVILDVGQNRIRTPLMHYLINSHQEFAEILLQKGVNGNFLTEHNVSLLNIACAAGAFQITQLLVELFPSLTSATSKNGISPLHLLFMFSESEIPLIAKLLVENNAPFLANGVMDLHDFSLILSGLPLHWAILTRSTSAVRALLDLGADVNQGSYAQLDHLQYPEFAVDIAVSLHMPEMVQLLTKRGALIFDRPEDSVPPALHYIGEAIEPFFIWLLHGNLYKEAAQKTVQVLLNAGLHVNMCSDDNINVLQYAATRANHQTYVLETILGLGPSVTTGNDASRSPIYLTSTAMQHDRLNSEKMKLVVDYSQEHLSSEEFKGACREALKNCAQHGTIGAASVIIATLGVDSKAIIEEEQLMHLAAEHDEPEMIRLLLDAGVDINFSSDGTSAASAAARGKKKALKFLLSNGSTVLSMRSHDDEDTILHDIVGPLMSPAKSSVTLSFVQENFQDLFTPVVDNYNMFGFTALHEAIIWGNLRNMVILLEHFEAHPRNVKNTDISPTTLITFLKADPPGYYIQQGELALRGYQETLDAMLDYLCETCELQPPNTNAAATALNNYWTHWPDNRLLAHGDITAWWRVRVR